MRYHAFFAGSEFIDVMQIFFLYGLFFVHDRKFQTLL